MSTQLIKPNYLVILPPTQHHSFFRNLPPLFVNYIDRPLSQPQTGVKPNFGNCHITGDTQLNTAISKFAKQLSTPKMLRRLLNIYTETKRRNRNAPKYSNCHSNKKLKFICFPRYRYKTRTGSTRIPDLNIHNSFCLCRRSMLGGKFY